MKNIVDVKAFQLQTSHSHVEDNVREIVFYDEGNSRSVINMVPRAVKDKILMLPTAYMGLSVEELLKNKKMPMVTELIRQAFWDEYYVATDSEKPMRIEAITKNVCSREYFYSKVITDPLHLAYILIPPEDYVLKMRGLLELGLRKFTEILSLPIVDSKGKADTRLINNIVHIVTLLDNRVKGAIPQKFIIDGRQMNVNMNYEAPKSHKEIQKQLDDLDKEIQRLEAPAQPLAAKSQTIEGTISEQEKTS